jgi:hypothetical protein
MTKQELISWAYGVRDAVSYADFAAKYVAQNPGQPVPTKREVVARLQQLQEQAQLLP